MIAVILEYILYGYQTYVNACTISLGIGIFWFILSSTKSIKHILHRINDRKLPTTENELSRSKLLAEFIHAHNDMKQLSNISVFSFDSSFEKEDLLMHIDVWMNIKWYQPKQFQLNSSLFMSISISRVANDFSDLCKPIVSTLFTWCFLVISGVLLVIHGQIVKYCSLFIQIKIEIGWVKRCFTIFHL